MSFPQILQLKEMVESNEGSRDQSGHTLLIDADSLLYYVCGKESNFEDAKADLDKRMSELLADTGSLRYVAFLSDPESFRKKLGFVREYKGNRKGRETPELLYALKVYAQRRWGFYVVKGFEADDCVSLHRNEGTITSPDKDVLRQVPGIHWNYHKKEWISTTESEAFRFLWLQTASGDSVDGVPGIPGIGSKRAIEALEFLEGNDLPLKVLQMYMTVFSASEGPKAAVDRFKETLDLVYLLRNQEDLRRLKLEMPPLQFHKADGTPWDTENRE